MKKGDRHVVIDAKTGSRTTSNDERVPLFHAIDVGDRKQVFLDGGLIESSRNVTLTMNPPRRTGEVLIEADQPWEHAEKGGCVTVYSSVAKHEGKVRVWYDLFEPTGSGPYDHKRCVCYAESDDGIHFSKPKLGLHEIDGSTANNVVLPGVIGGSSVWIDPNAPPEHRFKTQAKVYPSGKLHMHSSPDGSNWKLFADIQIGPGGWDTQTVVFWDASIKRYVMFTRRWIKSPDGKKSLYRAVRRLESEDLVHWENESTVLLPDETDAAAEKTPSGRPPVDFYGAAVFKYAAADRAYIMLAEAFWNYMPYGHGSRLAPGADDVQDEALREEIRLLAGSRLCPSTFDVQLCVSRDGKNFRRAGRRSPFMRLGPAGGFDSKWVWAMPNPIRMGDEIWIYYVGTNVDHNGVVDAAAPAGRRLGGVSRAVMRLDGFVSADAPYEGGELLTPSLRFSGNRLELNLDTSGGGSARVELLDESGKPIKGFTAGDSARLNGNSVHMPVAWKSNADLGKLAGRAVKIRFILRDCKLYAFQFSEDFIAGKRRNRR